jgi:tetratricopeptide (TPR) repeat protein
MKTRTPFKNVRAVFLIWTAALAAAVFAGVSANVALSRHVEKLRLMDPHVNLDDAQYRIGKGDEEGAMAEIREAIRKAPESPEPYRVLGLLHFRAKRLQEACDAFKKAIDRGSDDGDMRLKAISALMGLNKHQEAIDLAKKCIKEGYHHRTFPRYIAESYHALGKHAESIPYYQEALEGYPNDLYIMERLVQAYRATGQEDKSKLLENLIKDKQAPTETPAPKRNN